LRERTTVLAEFAFADDAETKPIVLIHIIY